MNKKLIYIAGPYSVGDVGENMHSHLEAAHQVIAFGHVPIVPVLSHYLHIHNPQPYEKWMELDLAMLDRCDGLWRLAGESPGADREVAHARIKGIDWSLSLSALIAKLSRYETN